MIRNGYHRHLAAEAERARLVEHWQTYPPLVQQYLSVLLRNHGLQVAQIVTEAVDYFDQQQRLFAAEQVPEEKEQRDDACPS